MTRKPEYRLWWTISKILTFKLIRFVHLIFAVDAVILCSLHVIINHCYPISHFSLKKERKKSVLSWNLHKVPTLWFVVALHFLSNISLCFFCEWVFTEVNDLQWFLSVFPGSKHQMADFTFKTDLLCSHSNTHPTTLLSRLTSPVTAYFG